MYGPVEGRSHDLTLLRNSNWNTILQEHLKVDGTQYYIYGDAVYSLRPWLQCPFLGNLNNEQQQFNLSMSSLRVAVEHSYKDVKQQWASSYRRIV